MRKWWRRRAGRDDREAGFTLVDVVASFVIMGVVIAPLTMALVQAMHAIGSSSVRTHTATDLDRLQSVFIDDVTQAQAAELTVFSGSYSMYTSLDGSGRVTAAPAATSVRPWFMSSVTSWTPASTSPLSILTCPPELAPSLVITGLSVPILDLSWSDGVAATGVAKNPPDVKVTYKMLFNNDGSGARRVELHRWVSTAGQPETDQGAYASGYCKTGDWLEAPNTWSKDNVQSGIDLNILVRPTPSGALDGYKISAAARPSGINPTS